MIIAAQMYSVHDTAAKGYADALKQVAEIGFKAVELAAGCGYSEFNDKPAAELKKCLDDLGLITTGAHVSTEAIIDPEARKAMIEFYSVHNAKYMICPYDGRFMDPVENAKFADDFNQAVDDLKKAGMYCGYHNHQTEFLIDPNTGKSFWETFADRTVDAVVLEQDCGWTVEASRDPADLIRRYPGRSNVLHFKQAVCHSDAQTKLQIIGQDSVDWPAVIKAAQQVGNTEYAIIEQEWYLPGKTDMECLAMSFEGLKQLMA